MRTYESRVWDSYEIISNIHTRRFLETSIRWDALNGKWVWIRGL